MNRTIVCALSLSLTAALAAGWSAAPSAEANGEALPAADDELKAVAPPADIIGKWRHVNTDGKSTRTSLYHFKKDGSVEVDVRTETPDRKYAVLVKQAVTGVEKDRMTLIEISHTVDNGVEDIFPAERRRTRRYQVEVKGDELRLSPVDEAGKPLPKSNPLVMKRVKK